MSTNALHAMAIELTRKLLAKLEAEDTAFIGIAAEEVQGAVYEWKEAREEDEEHGSFESDRIADADEHAASLGIGDLL